MSLLVRSCGVAVESAELCLDPRDTVQWRHHYGGGCTFAVDKQIEDGGGSAGQLQ